MFVFLFFIRISTHILRMRYDNSRWIFQANRDDEGKWLRTFSDTKTLHIFYAPTQIPVSRQTIRYKLLALNIYMCFIHIKRTLTFDIFSCIEKRKGTYVLSFGSLCELENRNHGKSTRIFSICYRMRRNVLRGGNDFNTFNGCVRVRGKKQWLQSVPSQWWSKRLCS